MNKKTFIKNFKNVSGAFVVISNNDGDYKELIALQENMGDLVENLDSYEDADYIPIVTVNKNKLNEKLYNQLMTVIGAIINPDLNNEIDNKE